MDKIDRLMDLDAPSFGSQRQRLISEDYEKAEKDEDLQGSSRPKSAQVNREEMRRSRSHHNVANVDSDEEEKRDDEANMTRKLSFSPLKAIAEADEEDELEQLMLEEALRQRYEDVTNIDSNLDTSGHEKHRSKHSELIASAIESLKSGD